MPTRLWQSRAVLASILLRLCSVAGSLLLALVRYLDIMPVLCAPAFSDRVRALAVSDDEMTVVSASRDTTCRVWRMDQPRALFSYTGHRKDLHDAIFVDRDVVASCDASVHVWNMKTRTQVMCVDAPTPFLRLSLAGSPHLLVGCTTDVTLRFLDLRKRRLAHEWSAAGQSAFRTSGTRYARSLAVDAGRDRVFVGLSSGMVSVLDVRTGLYCGHWRAHYSQVRDWCCLFVFVVVVGSGDFFFFGGGLI